MTQTPTGSRVSALFDTREHAEIAVNAIRAGGVTEQHFSIISRQDHAVSSPDHAAPSHDKPHHNTDHIVRNTMGGVGAGALFGIAAMLIPGVGPFIAAGTLLSVGLSAVGGAALAGAVVGGTTGLIASALVDVGYDDIEAHHYGQAIENGSVLVVVDTGDLNNQAVAQILAQHGGRTATGAAA